MKSAAYVMIAAGFVVVMSGCAPSSTPVPPTTPPEPTPIVGPTEASLPGVEVVPLESLGASVPWLPIDTTARPTTYYFLFNLSEQPFSNVLVRQAFAAATDREVLVAIANSYGTGTARPATTLTPAETLGRDLYNVVGIPFNPVRARQALDDAGYADRSTFPPITLLTFPGRNLPELNPAIAERLADMWRLYLGVEVTVESVPEAYFARVTTDPPEVYAWGWAADYNDPDDFLHLSFHSGADDNLNQFSLAAFDDLVDRAAASQDPAERQSLYVEAERVLCESSVALIPIFHSTANIP